MRASSIGAYMDVFPELNAISENRKYLKGKINMLLNGEEVDTNELCQKVQDIIELFKTSLNPVSVFNTLQRMEGGDDILYSHLQNVSIISYMIGMWLDLKDENLNDLLLAGLLADTGKALIGDDILLKKGALSDDEIEFLKEHVEIGKNLITKCSHIPKNVTDAVFHHHERLDGTGYPWGLKDKEITQITRIVAIADVFNALTSNRPHRRRYTILEAINIMETEFEGKLDGLIMSIFFRKIKDNFI